MGTLCRPHIDEADVMSVNNVKVVLDVHSCALYFSRALIPHNKKVRHPPEPAIRSQECAAVLGRCGAPAVLRRQQRSTAAQRPGRIMYPVGGVVCALGCSHPCVYLVYQPSSCAACQSTSVSQRSPTALLPDVSPPLMQCLERPMRAKVKLRAVS
jgi:hypothetical protein